MITKLLATKEEVEILRLAGRVGQLEAELAELQPLRDLIEKIARDVARDVVLDAVTRESLKVDDR